MSGFQHLEALDEAPDPQSVALVLRAAERMLERLPTEAVMENDRLFVRAQSLAELLEAALTVTGPVYGQARTGQIERTPKGPETTGGTDYGT